MLSRTRALSLIFIAIVVLTFPKNVFSENGEFMLENENQKNILIDKNKEYDNILNISEELIEANDRKFILKIQEKLEKDKLDDKNFDSMEFNELEKQEVNKNGMDNDIDKENEKNERGVIESNEDILEIIEDKFIKNPENFDDTYKRYEEIDELEKKQVKSNKTKIANELNLEDEEDKKEESNIVYLSDIECEKIISYNEGQEINNKILYENKIKLNNMFFERGVSCLSDTEIIYNLDRKYKRFTSYIGIDDNIKTKVKDIDVNGVNLKLRDPVGKVQFSVFADDVLIYFSPVINSDCLPQYIDVDISNKDKLKLVVKSTDKEIEEVLVVWAEACLYKEKSCLKAQKIEYEKERGTFIYCNNPESITFEDTLDNGKVIYTDNNLQGEIVLFAEQNNSTGDTMFYAIRIENAQEKVATVNVKNKGVSANWWTGIKWDENCWRDFYNFKEQVIILPSNATTWLLEPVVVSEYNPYTGEGVLNTIIRFNVDVPVNLKIIAFGKDCNINNIEEAIYEGYIIKHDFIWGEARNYKGRSEYLPEQSAQIEWEIDDLSIPGYLPVKYNNINYSGWVTHITDNKHPSALNNDMYEFLDPNGICFSPYNVDYSTMKANLGNWGIKYKENIKIKNTGDIPRKVDVILANAFYNADVLLIRPDGSILKELMEEEKIKTIHTLYLLPRDEQSYTFEYILPACSVGGLAHYLKLT